MVCFYKERTHVYHLFKTDYRTTSSHELALAMDVKVKTENPN